MSSSTWPRFIRSLQRFTSEDVWSCLYVRLLCLFKSDEGCTKNCSHDIPHGEVTWWCSAVTGNMCPYSCDKGYEKNPDVSWLSCSSSGEWRPLMLVYYISTEDICLRKYIVFFQLKLESA